MQTIRKPVYLLRCGIVFLLLLSVFSGIRHAAAADTFRFAVYYPHFPPYVYSTTDKEVIGIIPELLAEFFAQQEITPTYIYDNRSGAEHRLYKGDVDAMMLGPQWAKHPEQVVFSRAVLPYFDYLFSLNAADAQLTQVAQLNGMKVCTREYYIYPALAPFFADKTLLRVDASSQEAQLRMLENHRCELVYLNSLAAEWLVKQKLSAPLYKVPLLTESADFTVALHPRWHGLLPALNTYLLQQQNNGRLRQLISKHTK